MKKTITTLILAFICVSGTFALPRIPFSMGTGFPNYENTYILVNSGVYVPMSETIELNLTGAFGIRTEKDDSGSVDADFLIPINGGVNFLFPSTELLSFMSGFGLTAQMENGDDFTLHIGPYIKGGIRYRVHKNMQLTLELQQDLVFGPPQWINTGTSILAGILCNFN